ncbi:MAG: 2'-hydroxyisoflavone reductase [Planctomycetota bacterium]|jgi:2'-hydroxyisoflavone reductase
MSIDRRDFLKRSGIAGVLGLVAPLTAASKQDTRSSAPKKMKVLIIGGTSLIGPHVVATLKKRGHEITLFNRGRTNTHLFPELEKLRGDRNKDLSALKGRKWDVVIDNCGYFPKQIRKSTAVLKDSGFYMFISSVSAFANAHLEDTNDNSPLGKIDNPEEQERITGANYGPLKACCERETTKAFPGQSVIVRPGLIVGPGDSSDRFTYWPTRSARGGEMLAPGKPEWGTQFIDVRDLADWMVHLCEKKTLGTFSALGPNKPLPFGDLLESCKRTSQSDAKFLWMTPEFMKANKISAWGDMPLYVHPSDNMKRPAMISNKTSVAAGLKFRPVDETTKATLDYHLSRDKTRKFRAGISAKREAEVIKIWHAQQKKASSAK